MKNTLLDFDFNTEANEEQATYKGFTVRAVVDSCPINPFEDWDCLPPIVVHCDRYTQSYGDIDLRPPTLTRDQIKANLGDLVTLFGQSTLLKGLTDNEYSGRWNYSDCVEYINDCLSTYFDSLSDGDKISELPGIYAMQNVIALSGCATGYSQGDYADVLVVATPEFIKITGAVFNNPKDLQSAIDLYAAWAFGDVYGYIVEDKTGEEVSSCWCYYGSDHDESGLSGTAVDDINWEVKHRATRRMAKLTDLIKNRVPLETRQSVMSQFV